MYFLPQKTEYLTFASAVFIPYPTICRGATSQCNLQTNTTTVVKKHNLKKHNLKKLTPPPPFLPPRKPHGGGNNNTYCPPYAWMTTASLPVLMVPVIESNIPLFTSLYSMILVRESTAISWRQKLKRHCFGLKCAMTLSIIHYTVRPRKNETEKYRCFIIT